MFFDFSNYPLSNKEYGGSEKKLGISINGYNYMLKFQKEDAFGLRYNHVSEYLGSHIFSYLNFDVQETFLGTYNEKEVVACKDFISDGYRFVPFNDVGESTLEQDKERYQYSYEDIVAMLESNKKLTNIEETVDTFFEVFIVDALLGNYDRHGANWGFLKKNNKYYLAPIFDNGSCLYPQMIDEKQMKDIILDEEEIKMRVFRFPTSQIKLNGNKSSYYEVISSRRFERCNKALKKIFPLIDIKKINKLIDDVECISDTHKEFYKVMILKRYELILRDTYEKL